VIDTQVNPGLARRLRDHLSARFAKPILYAVNTHYHWDHTAGNALFQAAGATLIASRRTAEAMQVRYRRQYDFLASRGFEMGEDPVIPLTYAEDIPPLDLGGLTLELIRGKDAETSDPTLVWCPAERILAAGDTVMTGSFPIFGQPSQQEGLENEAWLAALDEVRGFGALRVVPGHGPVAGSAELDLLERIIRYFLAEVPRHHAAGRTLEETIRVMEDELPAWISRIPEVWGTPRYAILRVWAGIVDLGQPGWQHVKPSAYPCRFPPMAEALPDQLAGYEARVDGCLEGGDQAGAIGFAKLATEEFATDPDAWVLYARVLIGVSRSIASVLEKGDCFDPAKRALHHALALRPGWVPALLQLGQFHAMLAFRNGDDAAKAEGLLEQAGAAPVLTPRQRAEVRFYLAICARARGDEPGAVAGFRAAQAADPGFMPATLALMG
jgi:glyoxylase-like metal-dependent hydrolase (beta-lactamase superfamily II)